MIVNNSMQSWIAGDASSSDAIAAGEAGIKTGSAKLCSVIIIGEIALTTTICEVSKGSAVTVRASSTEISAGALKATVMAFFAVFKGSVGGIARGWACGVAETIVNQIINSGIRTKPVSFLDCNVVKLTNVDGSGWEIPKSDIAYNRKRKIDTLNAFFTVSKLILGCNIVHSGCNHSSS
jgi:hypothetical protein